MAPAVEVRYAAETRLDEDAGVGDEFVEAQGVVVLGGAR